MSTKMLIEFLNARLRERYALARTRTRAFDERWHVHMEGTLQQVRDAQGVAVASGAESVLEHIAANDPGYMMRDIGAKMRILESFQELDANPDRLTDVALHLQWNVLHQVIQQFATAFDYHPDFQQEWWLPREDWRNSGGTA